MIFASFCGYCFLVRRIVERVTRKLRYIGSTEKRREVQKWESPSDRIHEEHNQRKKRVVDPSKKSGCIHMHLNASREKLRNGCHLLLPNIRLQVDSSISVPHHN